MKKLNMLIVVVLLTTCLKVTSQFECKTGCVCSAADYVCTSCDPGYVLKDTKCLPCTQNCNTCNADDGTCTSGNCAATTTFLATPKTCKQCVSNCATCSDTAAA